MLGLTIRNCNSKIGSVISKLKMMRASNPKLSYLLVEGNSDVAFFKNVIDDKMCKVISCDGKTNVIDIINKSSKEGINGVAGIVDRDYDYILNCSNENANLFETDTNDMESMILKTKAFKKLINEYGDKDKISEHEINWGYSLLEHITNVCSILGSVRLANAKYDINLDFKSLDLEDYINDDYNLEETNYIETLIIGSGKEGKMSKIKTRIKECLASCVQKWDLCRGHDLTEVIKIILTSSNRNNLGNGSSYRISNISHFEQTIRIAYEIGDFQKTNLFHKLVKWQESNPAWIILDEELLSD